MTKFMSAKTTKTIDDLGFQTYVQFEENRKYLDVEFGAQAKQVAGQITTDVFEPLIISDYQILFELNTKGSTWGLMPPPPQYNDQRGRLFTYQLAPKLGPYDLIELQISRIKEKQEEEKEQQKKKHTLSWETEQEIKQIDKEANTLIQMMQNIQTLNKIMEQINSERYRYSKG